MPRAEGVLYLQPGSDETQCLSYLIDLGITPELSILEVKEDDVPPAMRERLKPNHDPIHWGCTIRVRWRKTSGDGDGDLYIGNGNSIGNSASGAKPRPTTRERDPWPGLLQTHADP